MKTVVVQVIYLPLKGYGPRVETTKITFHGAFNASMLPPKPSIAAVEHTVRVLKEGPKLSYNTMSRFQEGSNLPAPSVPKKSKWANPNNPFG